MSRVFLENRFQEGAISQALLGAEISMETALRNSNLLGNHAHEYVVLQNLRATARIVQ